MQHHDGNLSSEQFLSAALSARSPSAPYGVLDALARPVAVASTDWTLLFVNAAWARVPSLGCASLVGRDLRSLVSEIAPEHGALLRELPRTGPPRVLRLDLVEGDRHGTYELRVARLRDTIVCELEDVGALARTQRHYERLLDEIGEAVLVVDRDWRITHWNGAATRLTGRARPHMLGRVFWDAFPQLAGTLPEQVYRRTMETREPGEFRNWLFAGDDDRPGAFYDGRSYPADAGGVLIVFSEVSERLRRELALAERSAENESLRELARQMAEVADTDALLDRICQAALEQSAASGVAVIARCGDRGEAVATAGAPTPARGFSLALEGTPAGRVMEERATTTLDDYASVHPELVRHVYGEHVGPMMMAPLIAHDEVLGALVVTRCRGARAFDARHRQRLRAVADHAALALWKSQLLERAQEANRAKAAFLITVSHELRTPLAALTGYGELLADQILGPLTADELDIVERMRSVTHHLSAMIEEILTYSSLEAGRELVRASEFTGDEVVAAACAVVDPLARQKGIDLARAIPADAVTLSSDIDKVRQILVNLIGNAVKFTDRGGVTVSLDCADEEVRFAVHDTGIGIAEDDLRHLFQPFAQVDGGLTRRHGGTGLGLYISRRLATLLGGRVDVRSAVGEGSTFTLVLPRRYRPDAAAGR